uniref:Protein kinase domain-containing protein n=1 Tax=Phytophthora ramorum TaxID=164328 RepID=H3GIC4_PHYRM
MTGNPPLSRNFTAPQADFLRKLIWDLNDKDFAGTSDCASGLQQIHGVSVCIINAAEGSSQTNGGENLDLKLGRTAVERKLYEYEGYACSGYYSGAVLAGSIIGTAVFILVVGGLVWRWQKQKQGVSTSSLDKPTRNTGDSYVSVWQDPQLLALQIQTDEIQDVRKIGGGAYADVWLVKYRGTQLLASKRLRKVHETQQNTQNFVEEIKMAAKFDHPNVVRLVGAAWTVESDLQALSEYMVGGDLRDFLVYPQTSRSWTAQKLQIATDVIEALVYLHSFMPPVVHRDLKSRNILLSREMRAQLTDFGVSRILSEENTMTQGVGTSRWEAPEVLAGKEDYNQAADIFSFGVVLSELDTHAIPYDDARGPNDNTLANVAILQMIAMGAIRPSFSAHCPPDIRALAMRCLAYNSNDRPSAPEIAYALRSITL